MAKAKAKVKTVNRKTGISRAVVRNAVTGAFVRAASARHSSTSKKAASKSKAA